MTKEYQLKEINDLAQQIKIMPRGQSIQTTFSSDTISLQNVNIQRSQDCSINGANYSIIIQESYQKLTYDDLMSILNNITKANSIKLEHLPTKALMDISKELKKELKTRQRKFKKLGST